MLYRYDEVDIRDGMEDLDGEVSLDATVFISDGGVFKGIVSNYGTLIIRGGIADVVIGNHGTVVTHGGVLNAVVQKDGTLTVHEGTITVKEEGGFVNANDRNATVKFTPSEIRDMKFDRYTTIHKGTKAINCSVTSTGMVTVFSGGELIGDSKFSVVHGHVNNNGTMRNILIDNGGQVTCVDNASLSHCLVDHDAKLVISSSKKGTRGIIVKRGTVEVKEGAYADCITIERHGKLITRFGCHVTYRDHDGHLFRMGGNVFKIKEPKT